MKKNKLSVTVGIPTCYGGKSLLKTIKTIYASEGIDYIRCIIVADNIPIPTSLKKELERFGVEIYWNSKPGSQFKKLKQIISNVKSDIFIFTQDDIIFRPDTISEILKTFEENPTATMVGTRTLPLKPVSVFEKSMTSMVRIFDNIAGRWNKGKNYLAASGRCLSFKTKSVKKFNIREQIVNGDTYLYLENKRLKGEFVQSNKSIVYFRCPQVLKDQIGPSSRYQFSPTELVKYFDFDIQPMYKIPLFIIIKSIISELILHPISTVLYFFVFIYTRLNKQPFHTINTIWKIDESTKK